MNKKLLGTLAVMVYLGTGSVSAWDPSFLKTYPTPIKEGNWLINFGIGYGLGGGNTVIPPILLAVEYALPIGGLPFSVGGVVGFAYSHRKVTHDYWWGSSRWDWEEEWTWAHIPLAARIAYHFNWGVDKLDTYITTTIGVDIQIYEHTWYDYNYRGEKIEYKSNDDYNAIDWFMFGTHIGARYYFIPNFGAFIELGGYAPHYAALGVSFRF